MGTGSFSYLLEIAKFYVTVGSQLGDDVTQTPDAMTVGEIFIMYVDDIKQSWNNKVKCLL